MSKIAFVTDSTCNFPPALAKKHQVTVTPIYVMFGEDAYKDETEISISEFHKRLAERKAAGQSMPTTSQPTPADFKAVYEKLAAEGYTDVISIHVTAKSSGTCQSAQMASAETEGITVHVVDSATTSMHMGYMLLAAIDAVNVGGGVTEALAAIENVKTHSAMVFTVVDMDILAASGRTEGHQEATEAEISVKPIIAITDGVPKAVGKERTQQAALRSVLDIIKSQVGDNAIKNMTVVHANIPEKAGNWASKAAESLGFNGNPDVVDFGPGLAVHFGPGMLGVTVEWA